MTNKTLDQMKEGMFKSALELASMLEGRTIKEALGLNKRQNNSTEYHLRVNGKPIKYFDSIGANEIDEWLECVDKNPDSYVDISLVRTEILFSPHRYSAMQRHFCKA